MHAIRFALRDGPVGVEAYCRMHENRFRKIESPFNIEARRRMHGIRLRETLRLDVDKNIALRELNGVQA